MVMFSLNTIRNSAKNVLSSLFRKPSTSKCNVIVYENDDIKAMKVDWFPTMIQVGSTSIMKFDEVVDNPRLRKFSETDDEYKERMKLLDEQENKN